MEAGSAQTAQISLAKWRNNVVDGAAMRTQGGATATPRRGIRNRYSVIGIH